MRTRSPGLHSSKTYSPVGVDTWLGSRSCSKPVPPEGKRTKRFAIAVVRCDPGRKDNAPFSEVHFSSAIQKPSALGGEVYFGSGKLVAPHQTEGWAAHQEGTTITFLTLTVTRLCILDTHESLCSGTSPPIWGCLVMTMDCKATGS
jgi:hypothetical protein